MAWRSLVVLATLLAACGDDTDRSGEPCAGPAACDGLACVADADAALEDLAPLELVCGSERQGRAAGEACERGAQCASGICVLAGACVAACEDEQDCGEHERCQGVYARGRGERLHPVPACVAMVDLDEGMQLRVEVRENAFRGSDSGPDALELPGSERDALFVVEHLDDDTWPVPSPGTSCRPALCAETLEPAGSDAETWFDRRQLSAADGPINPIAIGDQVYPLTVRVPAGPRAQPSAAGYVLRVETKRPGRARITRIARTPESGQLNLNLYYAGSEAGADAIAAALEEVDRIFEPAGVFVGDTREIHVTGELLERGADLPNADASRGFARLRRQYGVLPQLRALFELSAGAGNRAVDVFFVGAIEGDAGGLAGGTPVPFGMHGTGASGVVLATAGLDADPAQLGRRLAHELGHALGLFHPAETNGDVLDPLPDTPSGDDAAQNLMFPSTDASGSELTPAQIEVIRRALVLD